MAKAHASVITLCCDSAGAIRWHPGTIRRRQLTPALGCAPDAGHGRRPRGEPGRADLPIVAPPIALAEALAGSGLPTRRLALFAWTELGSAERSSSRGGVGTLAGSPRLVEGEKARPLRAALAGAAPAATALLVGPEGGFAPAELAVAQAAGFEAVGLGERILRVETAAIVAVALVASAYGMLD